jgi:putative hydrolase of HD superfamily
MYSAASIQRWNDHARPVEFTELDKQAHKMIIAFVIARLEEDAERREPINWINLIEGGIFEFLHRIMLTDIKPAIFHEMMSKKGEALNRWVLEKLGPELNPLSGDFSRHFEQYFFDAGYACQEKRILKAAHYIATNWEFRILYNLNSVIYGIERTKEEIENQIEDHYDLIGVQKISLGKKSHGFLDLCGQLRFQQRWAQLPRLPKTSVLGHMLIVAVLSYLAAREVGLPDRRLYNDFFAALFHDLPEVLTRDIVHPIKKSVEGLDDIIRLYEKKEIDEKILPLLPSSWHPEMRFFIENEFENRMLTGETVTVLQAGRDVPADTEEGIDGRLIEACDKLAAYVEASLANAYGMKSEKLEQARDYLYRDFSGCTASGFSFKALFDYFL